VAIPPTGMHLRGNEEFVTTTTEKGVMVKDPNALNSVVVQEPALIAGGASAPYEKTTTYATESEPTVNPRTGNIGRIDHNTAVNETTTVGQPVQPAPVVYETVSGTSYQTVPTTVSSQEIRYHDY